MRFRLLRIIWPDRRGTALVEGAVMLPMLFVFFFGVFEFSWYFYEQHRVSTGIRDAARYIARVALPISDWLTANATTNPTIPPERVVAAKIIATTDDPSGQCVAGTEATCCILGTEQTCRVAGWTIGAVQITQPNPDTTPCTCQGNAPAVYNVEASTTFTPNSLGFLGFLRLGPFNINLFHFERLMPPPGAF